MTKLTQTARQIMAADSDIPRRAAISMAARLPASVSVSECEYWLCRDGSTAIVTPGYWADDGNCPVYYPDAGTGLEAAEQYVSDSDWGEITRTDWITVATWRRGYVLGGKIRADQDTHRITIEPEQPECAEGREHDWQAPYSVLGGLEENPGVWGHGGGVIIKRVCSHCGTYQITDTWAQDMSDGTQGLESVEYEDADADSMDWVERRLSKRG